MKKILLSLLLASSAGLASAYNFNVNNQSNYTIKVYNGATSDTHYVSPHSSQNLNLINGNAYQIQYTYTNYYKQTIPDNLGVISQDNNSGYISISLSQPGVSSTHAFPPDDPRYPTETVISWQLTQFSIGGTSYQTPINMLNWPAAPSVNGCQNASWGATCSASGGSGASITFTNNSY